MRKTGYENERIISDRTPDLRTPVLAWPQIRRVPPNLDPGRFEHLLQLVNVA